MRPNIYSNANIAALVMAAIVRCGGRVTKPCTGNTLVYCRARGRS